MKHFMAGFSTCTLGPIRMIGLWIMDNNECTLIILYATHGVSLCASGKKKSYGSSGK